MPIMLAIVLAAVLWSPLDAQSANDAEVEAVQATLAAMWDAIERGDVDAYIGEERFTSRGKSTRMFVKDGGRWLCIHGHYTAVE